MGIIFDTGHSVVGLTQTETVQFNIVDNPSSYNDTPGSIYVDRDATYQYITTGGIANDFDVEITNPTFSAASYTVVPAGIVSITGDHVARVADGDVELRILVPGHGEKRYVRHMLLSGVQEWTDTISYTEGSLAKHCLDQIDALVAGYTSDHSAQEHIDGSLSTFSASSPNIVMNPNCFVAGIDFSAISVIRSNKTGSRYPLCLIGPRHVISGHVKAEVGETVIFSRSDGSLAIHNVSSVFDVPGVEFNIGYLDTPVTGITPFTIPPNGFESTYMPCIDKNDNKNYPAVPILRRAVHFSDGTDTTNATGAFQISPLNYDTGGYIYNAQATLGASVTSHLSSWMHKPQRGDSNGPSFLMVNGVPVLLSMQHTVSGETDFSYMTSSINDAMDIAAGAPTGTYSVAHADFSGFTAY